MACLPFEKKDLIQASYVRFCELRKQVPQAESRVLVADIVFWGGLALLVIHMVRAILGNDFPDIVGAIAIGCLFFGWFLRLDARARQQRIREELQEIDACMREIGVYFCASSSELVAYVGEITEASRVSVLRDEDYR
jgi:hypothetical protein